MGSDKGKLNKKHEKIQNYKFHPELCPVSSPNPKS